RDERRGGRRRAEQAGPLEQPTARRPVLHVQGLNRFVDYRVDLLPHLRTSMEFSLGRDTLPSKARSVRGESRRLRRERDNAKKTLIRMFALADRPALLHRGHIATSIQRNLANRR